MINNFFPAVINYYERLDLDSLTAYAHESQLLNDIFKEYSNDWHHEISILNKISSELSRKRITVETYDKLLQVLDHQEQVS